MDIKELRKLPLPKLRDLAKESTDLTGVIGMKKEDLIEAVAKAKGITYEAPAKDVSTISSIKYEVHELRKQNSELLAASRDPIKIGRLRRKIKKLKRLTRQLAREAGVEKAQVASGGGETKPAASA
jgi:hypothetical protein